MQGSPRSFPIRWWRAAVVAAAIALLAACGSAPTRDGKVVQAANIPAGFDIVLLADKDGQFDLDGAPLTVEDLKSAIRYRKDESLPAATVLLKRGEKQRVKKEHISSLARLGVEMGFKAYLEENDGLISELQARAPAPD